MCRNIKTLFNFDPPATPEEVRAASVQFVQGERTGVRPSGRRGRRRGATAARFAGHGVGSA
jgi:hypothetical protein